MKTLHLLKFLQKNWFACIALLLAAISFQRTSNIQNLLDAENQRLVHWGKYSAKMDDGKYSVEIDESAHGHGTLSRLVHITATDKDTGTGALSGSPYAVTGHDYNDDGRWDRIFIRQAHVNGYNSIVFTKHWLWGTDEEIWQPCLGDKDKVQQFSAAELRQARKMLEDAMKAAYNKQSLTKDLADSRREILLQVSRDY